MHQQLIISVDNDDYAWECPTCKQGGILTSLDAECVQDLLTKHRAVCKLYQYKQKWAADARQNMKASDAYKAICLVIRTIEWQIEAEQEK